MGSTLQALGAWQSVTFVDQLKHLCGACPTRSKWGRCAVERHMWLTRNAEIARLFRKNGDEAKARVIEERLLKLLAVADTDHPLLKELRARH